jgi:hypothetical protein
VCKNDHETEKEAGAHEGCRSSEKKIFCDAMPCCLVEVYRRFGTAYFLHLKGRRVKLSKKPAELYLLFAI